MSTRETERQLLLSHAHLRQDEPEEAVQAAVDAFHSAGGDRPHAARALAAIANALAAVGMGEQAVAIAARAIAAAGESHDAATQAVAHETLGGVLRTLGAARAARREFRAAAAILRRSGDRVGGKRLAGELGHTYRLEGGALLAAGWPDQARRAWSRALRIYRVALRRPVRPPVDALLCCAVAECEYRLGRAFECRASANRALAQAGATLEVVAAARHWESQALRASGELSGALKAASLARGAAERLDDPTWLVTCLMAASKLDDLQGRFESATDFERRARDVGMQRRAREAAQRLRIAPMLERLDSPAPVAVGCAVA